MVEPVEVEVHKKGDEINAEDFANDVDCWSPCVWMG